MHKLGTNLAIVYWLKCRFNDLFLFLISDIFQQDWLLICFGQDKSFISWPGKVSLSDQPRYAQWDKKCLSLSQAEKSSAKSFELFQQCCSQSDVSKGVSSSRNLWLFIAPTEPGQLQLQPRDCSAVRSCLRFKYLQNALINFVVESLVKKVERHNSP